MSRASRLVLGFDELKSAMLIREFVHMDEHWLVVLFSGPDLFLNNTEAGAFIIGANLHT